MESFASEHSDKQERRVVDAVMRGNIEFLADEKAREISVGVDRREIGKNSHYPRSLVQGLLIRVDDGGARRLRNRFLSHCECRGGASWPRKQLDLGLCFGAL
jgi:hypothetical protein